jgi:hypothetical protein
MRGRTLNIASTRDHSLIEIVQAIERVTDGHAVYDVIPRGGTYAIDVDPIRPFIAVAGIRFDQAYLENVLRKYYAPDR